MNEMKKEVYIVDGSRTPLLKARGKPGPFAASDLAVYAARQLFMRLPIQPSDLDEVVTGCMMPSEDEANIGRVIALRLGCGKKVPGYTVQRNCASGMQAVDCAAKDILLGRANLVLAGGTEAMSRAPLIFNAAMVNWFANLNKAKTPLQKLAVLTKFRLGMLSPIIALLHGLTDPVVGLGMGQTAEIVAHHFGITRKEMDEFSVQSHLKAAEALAAGYLKEIVPIFDQKGQVYAEDDGVRRDSSVEKLGTLKPYAEKHGLVTAGNSSQVTDGAAYMILASKEAVLKYRLPVLAKIVDVQWAGLEPASMGLGPVHACTPILERHHLQLNDIDFWEINEAFATQVLGCIAAWKDDTYCKTQLGLPGALGALDLARLNIDGGGVAMGHPVGASGARIILHLAHVLKRKQAKRGMAAICIGGGQGGAVMIENVDRVE